MAWVGKTGSCHLFRHTCATLMLEGGADIRYIQALLGHEDLSSTEIYTHLSIQKLKQVHTDTHPARLTHEKGPNEATTIERSPGAEALLERLACEAALEPESEIENSAVLAAPARGE